MGWTLISEQIGQYTLLYICQRFFWVKVDRINSKNLLVSNIDSQKSTQFLDNMTTPKGAKVQAVSVRVKIQCKCYGIMKLTWCIKPPHADSQSSADIESIASNIYLPSASMCPSLSGIFQILYFCNTNTLPRAHLQFMKTFYYTLLNL